MPTKRRGPARLPRLVPDSDRLALPAAALAAFVVMLVCFWRGVEGLPTALRMGLTFVLAYVTVFLVSQIILRILARELAPPEPERPGARLRAGAREDDTQPPGEPS